MAGTRFKLGRTRRILLALLVAMLALAVAAPLAMRGRVAKWVLTRATASLCGTYTISGGHLGWWTVFALAVGRPVRTVLDDVRIAGPDGRVIFAAARFEASIEIHTSPSVSSSTMRMFRAGCGGFPSTPMRLGLPMPFGPYHRPATGVSRLPWAARPTVARCLQRSWRGRWADRSSSRAAGPGYRASFPELGAVPAARACDRNTERGRQRPTPFVRCPRCQRIGRKIAYRAGRRGLDGTHTIRISKDRSRGGRT